VLLLLLLPLHSQPSTTQHSSQHHTAHVQQLTAKPKFEPVMAKLMLNKYYVIRPGRAVLGLNRQGARHEGCTPCFSTISEAFDGVSPQDHVDLAPSDNVAAGSKCSVLAVGTTTASWGQVTLPLPGHSTARAQQAAATHSKLPVEDLLSFFSSFSPASNRHMQAVDTLCSARLCQQH
jgi:hypothetical protein